MASPTIDDIDLVTITPPNKNVKLEAQIEDKIPSGQELGGAMDNAIEEVRVRADRLQREFISPLTTKTRSFAEANPVLFTFLTIFTVMSIIPVACFIGFVMTLSTLIIGGAAIFIVLSLLGTILFGASILLPVLLISLTFTLLILGSLIAAFLTHRFYLSIRSHPESLSEGIKFWVDETKARVVGAGWHEGEGWIKIGSEVKHVDAVVPKSDDDGDETETDVKHTVKRE